MLKKRLKAEVVIDLDELAPTADAVPTMYASNLRERMNMFLERGLKENWIYRVLKFGALYKP